MIPQGSFEGCLSEVYFLNGPEVTQPPPLPGGIWTIGWSLGVDPLLGAGAPFPDMLDSEPSNTGEFNGSSAYFSHAQYGR